MLNTIWKKWLIAVLILLPALVMAAVPAWQIVPDKSSLTFTAIQNGAPTTGTFKAFSGDISFDPNQLSASHIKIIVDLASVSDAYNTLADTLKTPLWFNTSAFPKATFVSSSITKTGNNTYAAKGNLTLRDKTLPVTLAFTQEEYSSTKAVMKGSVTIQRTAFGVGQGEWSDTKAVKDDVKVNFTVTATAK
jgi:polyisoprenoid-binding protein YceI